MSGECIMFFLLMKYHSNEGHIFHSDIFLHKYLHSCFCSLMLNTRSSWEVFLIMISFPVHGSEIPFVLAYRKILRRSDNTSETVFEDSPCLFFPPLHNNSLQKEFRHSTVNSSVVRSSKYGKM